MNKQQRKQAVKVAQDVIDHLRLVKVTPGTYCKGRLPAGIESNEASAQKHIDGLSKDCHVCAIGACFLSYIRVYNNVEVNQFTSYGDTEEGMDFDVDYQDMIDYLHLIFPQPQLNLIESAFEMLDTSEADEVIDPEDNTTFFDHEDPYNYDADELCMIAEVEAAIAFGKKHCGKYDRLEGIMRNVIRNDGEFIPDKALYNRIKKKRDKAHKAHKKIPVELVN